MQISPVNILFLSKTSSRYLQDMSSRCLQDMFSRRLQDISPRRRQHMSSRRLQDIFSVTIFCFPRRLQDVFKAFSRRLARCLQDDLENEKLLRWRHAEDVFNTCLEDVLKTSWRPTNICWANILLFYLLFFIIRFVS